MNDLHEEFPQPMDLELQSDDKLSGFRLKRLEVFNWGTFNRRVWIQQLDGKNGLLTGDIGSGKSTLVDAITTLLIPAHRITYNKAAGADSRERTLRSYVLGHFKSERNEETGTAKPVSLRDQNSYSVILGVFHNDGYDQTVTLAQVFWINEAQGQPARFFVTAERDLSIATDFAGFGEDIKLLRKKLRSLGAEIEDSFPGYGAWFRRRFSIHNDQALELFHQTISMKSVGNLTDFVRSHMLEPFDVASRINVLIMHFDDLNRAHEAVLKAQRQVELLTPLVADCTRHQEQTDNLSGFRECRDALKSFYAELKIQLLDRRLQRLDEEHSSLLAKKTRQVEQRDRERVEVERLKRAVADQGGSRIEELAVQIRNQEHERDRRQNKARRHANLLSTIGEKPADDETTFTAQRTALAERRESLNQRENDLQNQITEWSVNLQERRREHATLTKEISSLKERPSNIPSSQVAIRQALCTALSVNEDTMPFVGELLQVRHDARDWEGAIERVLHNFGLSLLVQDTHYAKVATWVDRTRLAGRLVYFRVHPGSRTENSMMHPDSLVHKLEIKSGTAFHTWLGHELSRRFDYACCESQDQFRREKRAITMHGQIKSSGERHEKDDRYPIDDRSRYVLGWSNTAKIVALESQVKVIEGKISEIAVDISRDQAEQSNLRQHLETLAALNEFTNFEELDWASCASAVERLKDEKARLEAASDILRELTVQLDAAQSILNSSEAALSAMDQELGSVETKRETAKVLRTQTETLVTEIAEDVRSKLQALRLEIQKEHQLSVESCDSRERELRETLQTRMDAIEKSLSRLSEKIIKAMTAFKEAYKLETADFDASLDAASEYQDMLDRLNRDDLPRFEARFKELLNVNAINEIANFNAQLGRERETIKERIDQINGSLNQIDYNPGRYIVLELQNSPDTEIRDFQSELRSCTEGTITGSEDSQYTEKKFLQVKAIIDRFRGREGLSDLDRRWTTKVTDVRNWFLFAASERWREDNKEHEHYSDSGGKSGGQKEKLAYTILAASLAYQFGLKWGETKSRSFRFVVIDEAFGRGSDESTQYGLKLFQELNLQLLIVTPLQKIHVIEPYVASVCFVHNEDGQDSKLRNLSIQEYRAHKAELSK